VVTGSEPILPHSVEVQNNWTDAELYPHSSFTFKPAQPTPTQQDTKRNKSAKEVESESEDDDEYSSSEDEGEVFIQGALNKKKRGAPKEYLPKHREPVLNPLSVEERVKRKETRVTRGFSPEEFGHDYSDRGGGRGEVGYSSAH
jgi:hypothetical protein